MANFPRDILLIKYEPPLARWHLAARTTGQQRWTMPLLAPAPAVVILPPTYDWGVPSAAEPHIDLRTWISTYNSDRYPTVTPPVVDTTHLPPTFDWGVPYSAEPPIDLRTWTTPYNVNVYPPPFVQAPFKQVDWPVTPAALRTISLLGWIDATKLQLIGQDQLPENQRDWPNPQWPWPKAGRVDWVWPTLATLGTVRPFVQDDWPNPVPPIRPTYPWADQTKINLIGQDLLPENQKDWPNPLLPWPRWGRLDWVWPQAQVLVPVQTPFAQEDWPNSIRVRPTFDWSDRTRINLIGQDVLPENQRDWPNPRRVVLSPADWTGAVPEVLLPVQAPLPQRDWPNPTLGVRPTQAWYDQTKINLIGQDVLPENQKDWPNPIWPRRGIDLFGWALSVPVAVSAQPKPFLQTEWPNPVRALVYGGGIRDWVEYLNLSLTVVKPPFVQNDWPVPKGPVPAIDLRTWAEPLSLTLLGQDQFFGLGGKPNFDWPNPVWPRRGITLYGSVLPAFVAMVSALPVPFNENYDWPNPIPPRRGVGLLSWLDSVRLNLIGQDRLPFRQRDWPVPRGPLQPSVDVKTWVAGAVFGARQRPTAQRDWPVPRGPLQPISGRTWVGQVAAMLVEAGKRPFVQTDWPDPRGAIPAITLATWLDATKVQLIGQDQLPFRQNEWPVVPGRVPGINLRTYGEPRSPDFMVLGILSLYPDFFEDPDELYPPGFDIRAPEPTYDFPVGRSLRADYGIRGARRGRYVIGRR